MKNIRVIAKLDIKGPNVVKPVQTEALKVMGDPTALAQKYYQEGADEIIYLDIVASLYQRNINFDLLKKVAKDIYIPFTVGGGIRTLQDISNALYSGADKVAVNTHAINNSGFIEKAVKHFGSQCIVLLVEAKRRPDGGWEAYTDGGREHTDKDAVEWTREAISQGVGEILLTSIDQDGTRRGYDPELIKQVANFATVPLIAHGGASGPESMLEVISNYKVDAVSASTIFHYQDYSIKEIKEYLGENKINIRMI